MNIHNSVFHHETTEALKKLFYPQRKGKRLLPKEASKVWHWTEYDGDFSALEIRGV